MFLYGMGSGKVRGRRRSPNGDRLFVFVRYGYFLSGYWWVVKRCSKPLLQLCFFSWPSTVAASLSV